jgi:hypothetical protein
VHRLQSITYIRQSPAYDNRHGVIYVGTTHFILNINGDNAGVWGFWFFHKEGMTEKAEASLTLKKAPIWL